MSSCKYNLNFSEAPPKGRDGEKINFADGIWCDIGNSQRGSAVHCASVNVLCFYEGDRLDLSCTSYTLDRLEMSQTANRYHTAHKSCFFVKLWHLERWGALSCSNLLGFFDFILP